MTIQKNRALCLASLLLTFTLLAGCTTDPIFAAIEEEVKLKDPTMTGTITSLEVLDNNIYVTNGYLYKRTGGTGSWNTVSLPSGVRCAEVASDGTYLYALFQDEDTWSFDSVQLYDPSAGTWTAVAGLSGVTMIGSGTGRIYAFTRNGDDNYNAYVSNSSTTFNATAVKTAIATPKSTAGNYFATTTTVYDNTGAVITPLSEITGITVATVGSTSNLYVLTSGYVYRYDGSAWTSVSHDLSTPTANISYLGGSKNLLLIASGKTGGGFEEVTLDSGTGALGSLIGTPGDSDASSVAPSDQDQYDSSIGERALSGIYGVTGAVPAGDSYVLYAGVVHYSYGGLWSYYSNTSSEWNRE